MNYTRRNFLKTTLGTSALFTLTPSVPDFLINSMMADTRRRDERNTVLVVVQLSGGNDGLNTVVPYEDDEYARNRPTLRLLQNELHKIDSYLGFHPRMGAFKRLYEQGHLSIIQAVGYPNANRTHETAMRIWHTATSDQPQYQTGWLGRTVDSISESNNITTPAVFVGPIARPFALNAQNVFIPSINSLQKFEISKIPGY